MESQNGSLEDVFPLQRGDFFRFYVSFGVIFRSVRLYENSNNFADSAIRNRICSSQGRPHHQISQMELWGPNKYG